MDSFDKLLLQFHHMRSLKSFSAKRDTRKHGDQATPMSNIHAFGSLH